MNEKIIVCKGAAISFKNFQIKPVDLVIPRGYIVGLQGDNGSGKSTLIKMIAGAFQKMDGEILVGGINVITDRMKALSKLSVVSDECDFFMDESIEKNEEILSVFYNDWNHDVFEKMIAAFGLSKKMKISSLSKGQKVKFQMAFAAAHKPQVILLDEPTAGLDPAAREDFLRTLQELVAEFETTIVLATHLDEDICRIADYVIKIENGCCEMKELDIERR